MTPPSVSIILPVYNAGSFIGETLSSLVSQDFSHFEIIIVNDASIDNSEKIIATFKDDRIKYFKLPVNSGIVSALNFGIRQAKGKYIARMDADDIAYSNRIGLQYAFLESNPDVGLLGTNVKYFGSADYTSNFPPDDSRLKAKLLFHSPFVHPSVMGRREYFERFPYTSDYPHMEDYYLWFRMMRDVKFACLSQVLLKYREHSGGISKINSFKNSPFLAKLYREILESIVGTVSDFEIKLHSYTKVDFSSDPSPMVDDLAKWFLRLKKAIPYQSIVPVKEALLEIDYHIDRLFYRIGVYNMRAAWEFLINVAVKPKFRHYYYYYRVKSRN